jgi:plastocyanin
MKQLNRIFRLSILLVLFSFLAFSTYAKKWVVKVQNYSFFPYNLTHVKAGDTILFVWVEGVHSTTSTEIPEGALDWDYAITQQESSAMVIPMVNGTYKYVSTPDVSSGMDGTFNVTGALGISSPGELPEIRLFPNPATDQINVSAPLEDIELLRIFDMKGTKMVEMNFGNRPRLSTRTIDLMNLPSGVFFFEFTLESNKKKVLKVVHTGK